LSRSILSILLIHLAFIRPGFRSPARWGICLIGVDCRNWNKTPERDFQAEAAASFIVAGRRCRGHEENAKDERSGGGMNNQETQPIARTVASTESEMTEMILPNDTNPLGNLLGGRLMHFIDLTGAMAAYRLARTPVVTAAMDHIDFIHPVRLGDLVTLRSSVNRAFTSSMEVGVKVWAENMRTGSVAHVASAYLVFVAIDEHGRVQKVPQMKPETPDEVRRYEDAMRRREYREREFNRRKEAKQASAAQTDGKK
jgi:acyl-CoA hydrolase